MRADKGHNTAIRRFGASSSTGAMELAVDHPAIVEGRPLFKKSANEHKRVKSRVLVSGHNSRKIGKYITKGRWKGFPIFTLTLEERKTCPTDCSMWRGCYGNRMPWSIRHVAGEVTEQRIEDELGELQTKFPLGFVVRLHVLGDFYSVAYVKRWRQWLSDFPALHVFGFTARHDEIGKAVEALSVQRWGRFAIRSSGGLLANIPAAHVSSSEGIACPVETGKTECCGTCGLCWSMTDKPIVFLEH